MPGIDGGLDMDLALVDMSEGFGEVEEDLDEGAEKKGNIDLGNGLKVEAETKVVEGEKPATAAATPPSDPAATPAADPSPAPGPNPFPKTWKPELQAKWEAVDPDVRAEITRREEDMFRGMSQYREDAQVGQGFKQAFTPYDSLIKQYNIDPVGLTKSLAEAHFILSTGSAEEKGRRIGQLLTLYKIDPDLVPLDAAEDVPPAVKGLTQRLEALESGVTARQADEQAARQREADAAVDKFFSDPANVYAKDLASDIARLIKGGVATDLKSAYEQAMWANPVTRQKEQTRLAAESAAATKAEAERKAEAARKASSANVKTRAKSGSPTAALGSMDETLEAAAKEIYSRGS